MKCEIAVSDSHLLQPGDTITFYGSNSTPRGEAIIREVSSRSLKVRPNTWYWRLYYRVRGFVVIMHLDSLLESPLSPCKDRRESSQLEAEAGASGPGLAFNPPLAPR